MAVNQWSGRQRPEIWMVVEDGRPKYCGLTKEQAFRLAARDTQIHERARQGTRIIHHYLDVARDEQAMTQIDDHYTEWKGYRNGGR